MSHLNTSMFLNNGILKLFLCKYYLMKTAKLRRESQSVIRTRRYRGVHIGGGGRVITPFVPVGKNIVKIKNSVSERISVKLFFASEIRQIAEIWLKISRVIAPRTPMWTSRFGACGGELVLYHIVGKRIFWQEKFAVHLPPNNSERLCIRGTSFESVKPSAVRLAIFQRQRVSIYSIRCSLCLGLENHGRISVNMNYYKW